MTVPNFTAGQVLTAAELDTLRSALGMTIPDFTAGQVLTAAELNQLVAVANNPEVYGTATGGTGVVAVTIGGVDYNYTSFTSTGTLTITKGGLFEALVLVAAALAVSFQLQQALFIVAAVVQVEFKNQKFIYQQIKQSRLVQAEAAQQVELIQLAEHHQPSEQ